MVGCSTPSTTVSNALCRIAHGRGVAVGVALNAGFGVMVAVEVGEAVALNAGFGVTVDVLLAVELGEAVTLNAAFGVIVNVDVRLAVEPRDGVAL